MLVLLTEAYVLHNNKKISEATDSLNECINNFTASNEEFLNKYRKAFQHVIYSVKAFFIFHSSPNNENLEQILKCIPPIQSLSLGEKAAITGIKANVFLEYGIAGSKYALELARDASQKNPSEPEWSLLTGILLARIRHYTCDFNVTKEEIDCLESAYEHIKTPQCTVFLAQTYAEVAKGIRFNAITTINGRKISDKNKTISEYQEKAYQLYKLTLINNNDESIRTSVRCATGIFNLRKKDQKIQEEALEIVTNCLQKFPNNVFARSLASKINYELKNYDEALKHAYIAEKGGSYGASVRIFEMNMILNKEIKSEETFEFMLKTYSQKTYIGQTALLAICYYVLKKQDLSAALKYFFIAADQKLKRKDYQYYFAFGIFKKVDVCELVYNEVQLALRYKKYNTEETLLEKAAQIFKNVYPDVLKNNVDSNLCSSLCQSFKNK